MVDIRPITVLAVEQSDELCHQLAEDRVTVEPGYMAWRDTGERVTYPIPADCRRETKWIPEVTRWRHDFEHYVDAHPRAVLVVLPFEEPGPGWAYYIAGEDGLPIMHRQNWIS